MLVSWEISSKSCDLSSLSGWTLADITSLEGSWGTRCHLSLSILGSPAALYKCHIGRDASESPRLCCSQWHPSHLSPLTASLTSSFQFNSSKRLIGALRHPLLRHRHVRLGLTLCPPHPPIRPMLIIARPDTSRRGPEMGCQPDESLARQTDCSRTRSTASRCASRWHARLYPSSSPHT